MRETALEAKTLPELCTEIFLMISRVRGSDSIGDFETFRTGTEKLFQSFEKQCGKFDLDTEDIRTARYALAAFVDEAVLNSPWPHKEKWADNPLQQEYFGTYLAGEIFYDKLEDIRMNRESKQKLLEVYYLCLLLGFKGKYGVSGQEKLRSLIANVAAELKKGESSEAEPLSPHWTIADGSSESTGKLPRWIVMICWGILIAAILLYLGLFIKIRRDADLLNEKIPHQTVSLEVVNEKSS